MDSNVISCGKRKSPCVSQIFELNDGDISSDPEEHENNEPQAKIKKTQEEPAISAEVTNTKASNLENSAQQNIDEKQKVSQKNDEVEQKLVVEESTVVEETTNKLTTPEIDNVASEQEDNSGNKLCDNISSYEVSPVDTNTAPCITINFCDSNTAEIYKPKLVKFLEGFVEFNIAANSDNLQLAITRDSTLNPTEWVVVDETYCLNNSDKVAEEEEELAKELPKTPVPSSAKKKKKKRNKKEKELFILDSTPSIETNKHVQTKYSTKFLIEDAQNEEDKSKKGLASTNQMCFNCGSDHSLKDCPEPRVASRINANKQKFNMNKSKSLRYHLEEDQKYHHLRPGKISDKLREAMGLGKHQVPSYIYQMRLLGYPPGWLEEAKLVHSNLAMYDVDGNDVKDKKFNKQPELDEEKIIDFPGFNVPFEKGFKDEFKRHQTPPYSEQYNKDKMIDFFKRQCTDNLETCDMDLDTTVEISDYEKNEISVETESKSVEKTLNKQLTSLRESHSNISSPSLNDLEEAKETLLAALNDEKSEDIKFQDQNKPLEDRDDFSEYNKEINEDSVNICDTSVNDIELAGNSKSSIKNSSVGTPILKSSSPYSKLPNQNNFMVGVSPVINFENLPNSTGKYDQMTGVLQKVRNTLKNSQQKC